MRRPPFNPYAAIVIAVIAVSTSAILVKLADQAPAAIIANYRLLFAVLLMAPIVLLKYAGELKRISKRDWIMSGISGIFLAFHFIVWFESLHYTSVASSVVLVTLQPMFAFIGAYLFFKEHFSYGAIISMIITIFGSIIIGWGDFQISGVAFWGDMLALAGAVFVTAYFLIGQSARRRLSLMTYTFVVYGFSAIVLILYNIILGNSFIGYPLNHWWIFLLLAIIPTFLGHTLFNWALRWLSTATISMGMIFEPVGSAILAYFILHEKVTGAQWLGGTIIIFGLILFILSTKRKPKVTISRRH